MRTSCVQVDNLDNVIGREEICKIAVFDDLSAADRCPALLGGLRGLCTTLSGKEWCDVAAPEADKGAAISDIQKIFGFKREECAAFGDHMNDYGMLAACGRAYVPENAYPPLRQSIGTVIPANTEGGVILTLKKILEGREP